MQRAMVGAMGLGNAGAYLGAHLAGPVGAGVGTVAGVGLGAAMGRTANAALNSDWARKAILEGATPGAGLISNGAAAVSPLMYRAAAALNGQ